MPRIAALYAALLLMVFLALTVRVLTQRYRAQVVTGGASQVEVTQGSSDTSGRFRITRSGPIPTLEGPVG